MTNQPQKPAEPVNPETLQGLALLGIAAVFGIFTLFAIPQDTAPMHFPEATPAGTTLALEAADRQGRMDSVTKCYRKIWQETRPKPERPHTDQIWTHCAQTGVPHRATPS